MGTTYSKSYSPASVFGARPASVDVEDIHDQVHALKKLVQRQLKKVNKRYMELQEQHVREIEQRN